MNSTVDIRSPATRARAIKEIVRVHFELEPGEMDRRTRKNQIAWPRQVAMFLCRELIKNAALSEIGTWFGPTPFDHGTVMHACQKVKNRCETERWTAQMVEELSEKSLVNNHVNNHGGHC